MSAWEGPGDEKIWLHPRAYDFVHLVNNFFQQERLRSVSKTDIYRFIKDYPLVAGARILDQNHVLPSANNLSFRKKLYNKLWNAKNHLD